MSARARPKHAALRADTIGIAMLNSVARWAAVAGLGWGGVGVGLVLGYARLGCARLREGRLGHVSVQLGYGKSGAVG